MDASTADWSKTPFYAVGEATASALADMCREFSDSPFVPRDIRGGVESGTSEKLAHFILKDLSSTTGSRRLLYLTGDKNRDTLPRILQDGNFELASLQVYETRGSSTFAADLKTALDAVPSGNVLVYVSRARLIVCSGADKWWIVYFAPSAAEFVTPTLRCHFDLPSLDSVSSASAVHVAAIGPTTASFLEETLRIRVDVTPSKPSAESLLTAIAAF